MSFIKRHWLQRMQAFSVALPALYTGFLVLLAILGYGYLVLFPMLALFSLLSLVSMIWQDSPLQWQLNDWLYALTLLAIIPLAARQSLEILRVKPPLPAGRPLKPKEFPVLCERIDELRKTYRAPKIHHIKLNTGFAVEIVCTPHNGFPLRCTNTLLIGLPVMACMSPLHLKFLLAREIGHLALRKLNFRRRIPVLNSIWKQYARLYAEGWHFKTFLLRLFFVPFSALFTSCAYPALRNEHIIKNNCLIEITHTTNIAEMIAMARIKQNYLEEEFWPALNNKAFAEPKPPYMPYSSMDSEMSKALDDVSVQHYYDTALSRATALDATQPGLRESLTAIGCDDFVVPERKTENAGSHFFGKTFAEIQQQMDKIWYLENRTLWAMRYKRGAEEKTRLKVLHNQVAQALLSNKEAHEYLLLVEKYVSAGKALPFYKAVLNSNSQDAQVCYQAGRLLLAAGDSSGIKALQMAMDSSAALTLDCYQQIVDFLSKTGDVKQAQDYRRKIIAYQAET